MLQLSQLRFHWPLAPYWKRDWFAGDTFWTIALTGLGYMATGGLFAWMGKRRFRKKIW